MTVIELENVSKTYPPHPGARMLLGRGGLGTLLGRGRGAEGVTALHDINLSIEAGECVGIIGANGSGKTTLLKLLAGITAPSSGRVSVYARAVSLIELGAGFHDLLSGRENVYMNGLLLGMSKREVDAVMESILEFADIGEAIDQPVGAYSSGMKLRLAFATAVHADPDIFLLDEVLAVGDEAFQRKCRKKMAELRDAGKTFVYISHDLISVSAMCDRCYLLQKGELIDHGDVESTIDFYVRQSVGATSHTLSMQGTDVVFRDGRLSIFRDGNEITAPVGCQTNLMHHGQWRYATFAAWRIVEAADTRLVAEGRMPTLPVSIRWTVDLDEERLRWNIAMVCDRDVAIEEVETNVYLPASYRRWRYESQDEAFPDILEENLACVLLAGPEVSGRHAAALDHSDGLPAVTLDMDTPMPSMRLRVQNSDHALGCRILQAWTRLPAGQGRLEKGEYDLVTLTLRFNSSDEEVSERFDVMGQS